MSVLGMMFSVIVSTAGTPVQIENCEYDSHMMVCDITNGSLVAIKSVDFDVLAKDELRTVPWNEPDGRKMFGADFSGGIEPQETIRHYLTLPPIPSRASEETLILELMNLTAYGPDGEPLN